MTGQTAAPARTDIAQDLIGRVEAARRTWRAPAHVRQAATADDAQAAHHAVLADTQALRYLVTKHGWPGRSLVGDEGSAAALAIALQADHDPAFQKTLLAMLAEAVRRGDATTAQWAHLHDRCLVPSRPQEYGTQYWLRDGRIELHPVAAPEGLDKRRADVGLPPLREQAALLERHHLTDPHRAAAASIGPAPVTSERPAA
ncbi:DUF6624 domain-containing protein [Streptomyces sp. NPDC047072]|uniref:DUF6624 domain-containing protein n=1 Tax=Streptomyces sp. NPDC047072 TaxID=3154809 RepID=UPI0033D92D71